MYILVKGNVERVANCEVTRDQLLRDGYKLVKEPKKEELTIEVEEEIEVVENEVSNKVGEKDGTTINDRGKKGSKNKA